MPETFDWDPEQYAKFSTFRARPFWDLADLVVRDRPIKSMVDLGCGTGDLTVALAERLGVAKATGIDASAAMLKRARRHEGSPVEFVAGDLATWKGENEDLIIANASLQWVAHHPKVLQQWVGSLAPGGQIAVQVPANSDHPSHTSSVAVAARAPFVGALGGVPPPDPVAANVLAPAAYSTILHDMGIEDPHVRLQVYPQLMPTSRHVVEWVKATSPTRFFKRLPPDLHAAFVEAYANELIDSIGFHAPYLYTFKRIFMWGRKAL